MAEHTHWKKTIDSRYLDVSFFDDGKDRIVKIKDVLMGDVTNANGTTQKPIMHFEGGIKPMVLNVTNMKTISKVLKSPYFDEWVGKKIQLYPDYAIPAFGTITEGIRVREFAPQ